MVQTLLSIPADQIPGTTAAQSYTEYQYTYTATEAQTYVTLQFRQDPAFWAIDDVSFQSSAGTQLLTNGGFETGNLTGWTLIGTQGLQAAGQVSAATPGISTTNSHSGGYFFRDGAVNGVDGLYQAVSTTPGQLYTVDFWLAADGGGPALAEVQVGSNVYSTIPANLLLAPASDTGVQGDNITSIAQPTITGTAAVGDTVTLYNGATAIGTATVANDGTWSIAATAPLATGNNSLTATQTDGTGHVSAASAALTITLDTPPAPVALLLASASDTGVQGDDITSIAMPTITGSATSGQTVTLYNGVTPLGTAVAAADGTWSITAAAPLSEGANSLTATATDAAGNASTASAALTVTLDTVPPVVTAALLHDTGASATDAITSDATLTGTADAGTSVALAEGTQSLGTVTADGTGHWTFAPAGLADGAHTITVSDTDAAGNLGTAQLGFTLDNIPPAPPATLTLAPASDSGVQGDDVTNITMPVLTGTAEIGSTVALFDGVTPLGTAVAAADGTWSITAAAPLSEGANSLTATATDAAGNASTASAALTVTLDTVPPVVTAAVVDNPADPVTHATLLAGTGDPNATITISESGTIIGSAQSGANGAWTFDPSGLTPGAHSLVASDTDPAGNTGTSPAVSLIVADPRFGLINVSASTSGSFIGSDYTGPVSYLQAQYAYSGADNVVLGAKVANVFLQGGSGEDALAAKAGSNVLDGGTGSSWLVGASGTDGGADTFFVDGRGGQSTWDTLLNFHTGDNLTLWGFNAAAGSITWSDDKGAAGYHGATLQADFGAGSGTSALVTLGGLSTTGAQFATSTGTSGGISYLALTRTG